MRERQQSLIFSLPPGDSFSPKELAGMTGFSAQHIRDCFSTGKIYGFQSNGRAEKGREVAWAKSIPRAAAALWLAQSMNCHPDEVMDLYGEAIRPLKIERLVELKGLVDRLIELKQEGRIQ